MNMRILLPVAALCAFALTTAPATAFTEFVQKQPKSGHQSKGGNQIFKIPTAIECKEEQGSGSSTQEKSNRILEEATYEKCEFNSIKGPQIKVTPIVYELHANGTVSIQNKITFKVEVLGGKCLIEVAHENKAGGKNENLGGITYTNNKPGVSIKSSQKGSISYDIVEDNVGVCGSVGAAKNGSFEGETKTQTQPTDCVFVGFNLGQYVSKLCMLSQEGFNDYKKEPGYTNLEVR